MTSVTELDGSVALVVGPAHSAERIALELARAGCGVAMAETDYHDDDDVAATGPEWIARLDARGDADLAGLAEKVVSLAGRIDILVQHHVTTARGMVGDLSGDDWAHDLARVTAALQTARGFASVAQPNAAIVTLVSYDAGTSYPGRASAAAVSAALQALSRSLAVEWASIPIRVNAVAHGVLSSADERAAVDDGRQSMERVLLRAPGHEIVGLAEVASLVRFLVGPGSEFITGQSIAADGGWAALTQHPEGLRFP